MKYQTRNTLANKGAREQFQRSSNGRFALWKIAAVVVACICAVAAYGMYTSSSVFMSFGFLSGISGSGSGSEVDREEVHSSDSSLSVHTIPVSTEEYHPKATAEGLGVKEIRAKSGMQSKVVKNPLLYSELDQSNVFTSPDYLVKSSTKSSSSSKASLATATLNPTFSPTTATTTNALPSPISVSKGTAKVVSTETSPIEALLNGLNGNKASIGSAKNENSPGVSEPKQKQKQQQPPPPQQQQNTLVYRPPNNAKRNSNNANKNNDNADADISNKLVRQLPMDLDYSPSYAVFNNISLYFQNTTSAPRGVVFIAHGCKRHYTVWWPKTIKCITCLGMPVERKILRQILDSGFMFITASPIKLSGKSECWHKDDSRAIGKALSQFYDRYFGIPVIVSNKTGRVTYDHARSPPLHLISVSNGVQLVGQIGLRKTHNLGHQVPLASLVILVGGIWEDSFLFPVNGTAPPFPPTLFIDTSRNSELALHNLEFIANIRKAHGQDFAKQLVADPLRVDPLYFHQEGCALTEEQSRKFYQKLQQEYALWPNNDRLLMDPFIHAQGRKLYEWALEALPEVVPYIDDMKYPLSPLLELLIVAYGDREIHDVFTKDIIEWMGAFDI